MALLKRKEGLNLFYKIAGLVALSYMKRYLSIDKRTSFEIEKAVMYFKRKLQEMSKNPLYLNVEKLEKLKFLKEKHYIYGSYLASISSFPILYSFGGLDCIRSIFAKTAFSVSTKMLDNANDQWHSVDDAITSLGIYDRALTEGDFELNDCDKHEIVRRAENSAITVASWAYQILSCHAMDTHFFEVYKQDIHKLIDGQIDSLKQRSNPGQAVNIKMADYLKNISEKSIGNAWFDYDLCFYEKNVGGLDQRMRKAIEYLYSGTEYIFKSTLVYDDISDLEEDLNSQIINSVILLTFEQGICSVNDLMDRKMMDKIMNSSVIEDAISLADLLFLNGVEKIARAREYVDQIDTDALIFNARILRIFNLRKWVLHKRSVKSLLTFLNSLNDFKKLKASIPDHIFALGTNF